MKQITIDLVDKRHIIARSTIFTNGAEVYQFYDELEAREFLTKWLKKFRKEGYKITEVVKDSFLLRKD